MINRPFIGVLLFAPLVLLFANLVVWDYFCVHPEPVLWALVVSVPLSGTLIRMSAPEAARFLVGDRWSLPIFMGLSLAINAMLGGVFILPYWLFRALINPMCS